MPEKRRFATKSRAPRASSALAKKKAKVKALKRTNSANKKKPASKKGKFKRIVPFVFPEARKMISRQDVPDFVQKASSMFDDPDQVYKGVPDEMTRFDIDSDMDILGLINYFKLMECWKFKYIPKQVLLIMMKHFSPKGDHKVEQALIKKYQDTWPEIRAFEHGFVVEHYMTTMFWQDNIEMFEAISDGSYDQEDLEEVWNALVEDIHATPIQLANHWLSKKIFWNMDQEHFELWIQNNTGEFAELMKQIIVVKE